MSASDGIAVCANCGRELPEGHTDPAGWCAECRQEVVRRATIIAHALAGVSSIAMALWVISVLNPGPRFVLLWLMLTGAIYYLVYKLARRVSFEVIQTRGVRPPKED